VRPASTLLLFAEGTGQLPFDVALLRALSYKLDVDGKPTNTALGQEAIAARLREARELTTDSPVYELVDGFPDIQRLKTDVFRDRVNYRAETKARLVAARKQGSGAVQAVEAALGNMADQEAGVVIDLYLSYRAVKGWKEMIALVPRMAPPLARSVMVQEQLGLALNRDGRGEEAEQVLLGVIEKQGPSSETYGILGRVYKDRWEVAHKAEERVLAEALLDKAIDAYLRGFEADWRDAYPGINAVTLMEIKEPPDPRRIQLIPVVAYAVERRIASGKSDYWDYATRLELAILAKNEQQAQAALCDALASVREKWELETTIRNIRLLEKAREKRNETQAWVLQIEEALEQVGKYCVV